MQSGVGTVRLPDVTVFALTGEDRKGWLQGQVTQDLRDLQTGSRTLSCLCSSTGQLLAILEIYEAEDALYIITGQPQELRDRVQNLVILEEVELEDIKTSIISYQGPQATKFLSETYNLPTTDIYRDDNVLLLRNDRTGVGGWDAISLSENPLPEAPAISEEAMDLASLEAGIPVFGVDTNAKTLPPELGDAFENQAISYRKGCYMGQEVLQRIHSRGHTNKTWVGLLCDASVNPGDEVVLREDTVGKVTRAGFSPQYGAIAAATLKNKAAVDGTMVKINGVTAEVVPMPILTID